VTLSLSDPRTKQRWALLASGVVALMLFASVAALALVNDTQTAAGCDLHVANKNASRSCTTTAGAIVEYIGSTANNQSSGTGNFNPFLRLQGSPTEKGFNTNGAVAFDTKGGTWTHAILVSAIPIVTINGLNYWELFVDINDGNSATHISLNEMEIWFTTNASLVGYVDNPPGTGFPAGATKQYDFSGAILINDVNQGSGRGDLRYLVPLTNITLPPANTYFVVYSKWGTSPTAGGVSYASDGGFEEWKVKVATPPNAPSISTTLSANPVNIGTAMHDSATLTGATATAGGTVTYSAYAGANTCSGTDLLNSTVTVTNGQVPISADFTPTSAGTYSFQAVYNGDARNLPASSTCSSEQLVVSPNTPGLTTTPSNDLGLVIGTTLQDSATLSNASSPTGSIDFALYGPDDAGCLGTAVYTESVALTGNSASTTTGFTTAAAGTYAWTAHYDGDGNNSSADSGCTAEEVTIAKNSPDNTTAQSLIPDDTLSLSGQTSDAGGTVDFYLFAPDVNPTCSDSEANLALAAYSETGVALETSGKASTGNHSQGDPYVATLEGVWHWLAIYSGDDNNEGTTSACVETFDLENSAP
jgi:hypothetical protein